MAIHKVLVTGANGQLGWELAQAAVSFPAFEFVFVDRNAMDLSNPNEFEAIITLFAPDAIINTAAYTAVDKAESEKVMAYVINAEAVACLASIAKDLEIPFITYSTDYVFDGWKKTGYVESDIKNPLSVYGASKAFGEDLIEKVFLNKAAGKYLILRTSWMYGNGNNFIRNILQLAKINKQLKIIQDQCGIPTSADWLAKVSSDLIFNKRFQLITNDQTTLKPSLHNIRPEINKNIWRKLG